ncbi:MAG TPA: hypothetical protein PLB73_15490 [Leptospiraceae bacterium]|nr:hypothetical protein [Leptospiraceae bacterium]
MVSESGLGSHSNTRIVFRLAALGFFNIVIILESNPRDSDVPKYRASLIAVSAWLAGRVEFRAACAAIHPPKWRAAQMISLAAVFVKEKSRE